MTNCLTAASGSPFPRGQGTRSESTAGRCVARHRPTALAPWSRGSFPVGHCPGMNIVAGVERIRIDVLNPLVHADQRLVEHQNRTGQIFEDDLIDLVVECLALVLID